MLDLFGVSSDGERIYRLLTTLPTATDIAAVRALVDWPVDRVGAAIDELVGLGLVRRRGDRHSVLAVVRPDVALPILIQRYEDDLAESRRRTREAREAIPGLVAEFGGINRAMTGGLVVERLIGLDAVRARLAELDARFESSSFQPPTTATPAVQIASLAASAPLDTEDLRRGARVRSIYHDTVAYNAIARESAARLLERGGEVRVNRSVPMRMLIVDREVAVLPIDPADASAGAYVLTEPGLVTPCVLLFEAYWEASTPMRPDEMTADVGEVSAHEREVLRLLANGGKDDAIARQLGISVRTVRRQIADIMERLGASSRFEAGVRATSRGWL